jgi:hypothetical protein
LGLALFAMFAFSVVAASMASAADEWLIDGSPVAALTSVEMTGEFLVGDLLIPLLGSAEIKCNGILDGTVGAAGESEITEMLTGAGFKVGAPLVAPTLACTNVQNCPESPEFWPVGLPWLGHIELFGTEIDNGIFTLQNEKLLGFEVVCHKTVIGTVTDTCVQESFRVTMENMVTPESDVLGTISSERVATCTLGGTFAGDFHTPLGFPSLIAALEGLTLAIN